MTAGFAKRSGFILLSLGGLLGLCALNRWAFGHLFGIDYLRWCLDAGPFIGLAMAAFGAAWGGLDKNPGLVSANPLTFVGASMQLAGLPVFAFGTHLRSMNRSARPSAWDLLAALPLVLVFAVAALGWLLLIVPPQYFAFLIFGAPSRLILASKGRIEARWNGYRLEFETRSASDPEPGAGSWDASLRDSPVTLANAFGAATLFLAGLLWRP